jgi:hypothetical protein
MSNIGISSGAFRSKSAILAAHFGSNCSFVGENAFKDCINLTQINDDNVIEEIGLGAFMSTGLQSATFNIVSSIGSSAFQYCSNLKYISIPYCANIPNNAFEGCSELSSISISVNDNSSTTTIGKSAFKGCTNLSKAGVVYNTIIDNCAFQDCEKLSDIKLDDCVKIGYSAFYGCGNISKISLSKCSGIQDNAFFNCNNLKSVYLNNISSMCYLGSHVFYMGAVSTPTINESVKFYVPANLYERYKNDPTWKPYWDNIFQMVNDNQIIYTTSDNKKIEGIDDIDYITKHAYGLIEFNSTVLKLTEDIFKSKENLTSVIIPSECKEIGENAFNGCKNLIDVEIPKGLTNIGAFAFHDAFQHSDSESAITFEIPYSVKSIGEGAFGGCTSITNFNGNGSPLIKYWSQAIVYNKTLICVLPKVIRPIIDITQNIDKNITRLGEKCFYKCENLRRVDISENITEIGNNAFEGCKNLREVHFHGSLPNIGTTIFGVIDDIRDDFKIFIPEDKLKDYYNKDINGILQYYSRYIHPMPAATNSLIYYSTEEYKIPIPTVKTDKKLNSFTKEYYYIATSTSSQTLINIPSSYFQKNRTVTDVILNENVKMISTKAFFDCSSLKYIYLPDTITGLYDGCFCGCISLTNIHIPSRCIYFGDSIFYGCVNLKEFNTYPNASTINSISDDGRCYITNNKLQLFAPGQLSTYKELHYTIPIGITEISKSAFKGTAIVEITLQPTTTTIGESAFEGCTKLERIYDWSGVTAIGKAAFSGCVNIGGNIGMPSNLTSIMSYAFYRCENMNITNDFPDSITSIGEYAFYGCKKFMNSRVLNLTNIKNINKYTFYNCTSLTAVNMNDNITKIDNSAFDGCKKLTNITISDNTKLETIGDYAFYNCTNLAPLNLSNAKFLHTIGKYAFYNCTAYQTSIDLSSITTIGAGCFCDSGITELIINSMASMNDSRTYLSEIPVDAFKNCTQLQNIKITSRNLETIKSNSFSGCSALKTIMLTSTSGVKEIGESAFEGCTGLTHIYNYKASYLNTKNILTDTITTIYNRAFYGCVNLNNITLPTGLTYLGHQCFDPLNSVNRLNVTIPDGLTTPPQFPITSSLPFGDPSSYLPLKIHIPINILSTYKEDEFWGKYTDYMWPSTYKEDDNIRPVP